MIDELVTPAEVADVFKTSVAQILEWRRKYRWPSVTVGKTIRFTPEQVAAIVASHIAKPAASVAAPTVLDGQTKRSAARSA